MRELKFRALELDSPSGINWIYGSFVAINGYWMNNGIPDHARPCVRHYIYSDNGTQYEVAESTVGQFTGLTDKNGADIYEGDILDDQHDCGQLCTISWFNDEARFCNTRPKSSWLHKTKFMVNKNDGFCKGEIIGNIYENPELLEVDK